MTQFLASVKNKQEALMALEAGADMIDLKNPAEGALGALPLTIIREIVDVIDGSKLISATIGDLPMEPALIRKAVEDVAATGVDIVKIGFFPTLNWPDCARALGASTAMGLKLVGVIFADLQPDFGLLTELKSAGFYGVMLDTAKKDGSSLLDHMSVENIQQFINSAKKCGLKTGLAGSLKPASIPGLSGFGPDYLGFRSALCAEFSRQEALDINKLLEVKLLLYKYNKVDMDMISI